MPSIEIQVLENVFSAEEKAEIIRRVTDAFGSVAGDTIRAGTSVRLLEELIGTRAGASTGTSLWAALRIVSEMVAAGTKGSVVSLICDPGERYLDKYYSQEWLEGQGIDIEPYRERLDRLMRTGALT